MATPEHVAVNVPVIDVDVCDAIWYWKSVHEVVLMFGRVADVEIQVPTSCGVVVDRGPDDGVGVGVVGFRTFVER